MAEPTTPDDTASGPGTEMDRSFAAALRAAEGAPESADAWAHLEELADELQRPDDVAELYRTVLERRLPKDVFNTVAEQAVQFHEEWFGDMPDRITKLMSRIIELEPTAEWAFERLTVMLTSASQWDELLALFDRTLATTQDTERRRRMLNDAAQAAKDFADQADRAADYMQQLLLLEPDNTQLFTSLERLLEKGERWKDLIELWESQVPQQSAAEARKTQLRMATCWVDQLGDSQRALDELRVLLRESPGHEEACAQAERILNDEKAELGTRSQALSLLRKNYLVAARPEDVVRVLVRALEFVEPDEKRPLHREAATRLAILARDIEAIEHYRQLLLTDPTDADARKQLRQLAKRSGRQDLHASALVDAADASTEADQQVAVLLEAAQLRRTVLDDEDGAIDLYSRVLETPDAEHSVALTAAHNLNELLAAADRSTERLAVLEKLADLEQSSSVRRFVLGEAARLADALGDADRALASWRPVLESDEHDLEALAAVIELLERNERWEELVDALSRRAVAKVMPLQRRADLVRIAKVQVDKLEQLSEAIETWLKVRGEFGENDETIAALDELMSRAERHGELAELLGQAAQTEHGRASALLVRVGDLQRVDLGNAVEAVRWYADALSIAPADEGALAGLQALMKEPECGSATASALAQAYEATDHWQGTLELLEARLEATTDRRQQAHLLGEAARLQLDRASDQTAALACLCRALPLEPDNLATEADLLRLAEQTERWPDATEALQTAATATGETASRAAQLFKIQARIHETRLDATAAALTAYRSAAEAQPDDAEAFEAIARCAARAGQWDVGCDAAIQALALRDRMLDPVIDSLTVAASEPEDWAALARALAAAVAENPLRTELAQQTELLIAQWTRDHCEDLDAAEQAAGRAVGHNPEQLAPLELLASLQRRHPDPELVTTLVRLDGLQEHSLDPLFEAAILATESQHGVAKTRTIIERLYRKSSGMWVRDDATTGEKAPAEVAEWALNKLIEHHILNNDADQAVHVLMDGTRLPLETEKVCALRRRAGEMLAERGDRARAIDVYRGVLDEMPNDMEALQRTAELCQQEGRVPEALSLRLRELELIEDVDRRLQLRLDHSRLTGALEAQGGRVASLKANLDDAPGHDSSLDELTNVLDERGRHDELADILTEQASRLESLERPGDGAKLWSRVAALAEKPLGDHARAIAAHTRVVLLSPSNDAIDALARLHLERNEPAQAAMWLERRLETTTEENRVAVRLKLAHAQIEADQQTAAIESLSTAFDEAPRNAEVRKLLLGSYRTAKNWEALGQTLTKAALNVADERNILAYAREAAEIYHTRLKTPEASVAALRRAVEIASDDRELRTLLAEGLRAAGELDEAKELLESLIKDYGRRRSPERAQAHLQVARVSHAQGETAEALDQLETASRMDAGNATILKTLAEMARDAGELSRAERAYRTLLVTVRREDDPAQLPLGPTEVLLELSRISADRDEEDKASELIESVLESLTQNDFEAPRIQSRLRETEDFELLHRVLNARLGYVQAAHKRGQIYGELGEVLDSALDRQDEALSARLEAIKTDPSSPIRHQAAWDHAARLDKLDRYVSVVETLLTDERADSSAHVRCELLLRLGEVLEKEREDLGRAAELYEQAEATGVRKVDVWRAQARVAGAAGDSEKQMRLLGELASLGEDQADTRADALYRIAEVQLATAETLDEGLESMTTALADSFKAERAALILSDACERNPDHVGLLDLYEQVARKSQDDGRLLHYLERRAEHETSTPEQAHEAVTKAIELEELERAEALMLRAAEIGQSLNRADDLKRVDWALLGLADRRMVAGDLAGAVKWLSDAAEVAELEPVFELSQRVADMAAQPDGDLTLAAKLYERLLERAPTRRETWEPLAVIYAKLGDTEQLEQMVAETLDGLEEQGDRSALRVALATAYLGSESRAEDAVEVLQRVLVADPQHEEAQSLLVSYLERTGRTEELVDMLRQQLQAAEEREDEIAIKASALQLAARVESTDRDEALEILRRALRAAPTDEDLLRALLERLGDEDDPRERAELTETLIKVEPAESAGPRTLVLVEMVEALDDEEAALRVLQLGAERAPDNEAIRTLLQERYRARGDFRGLADSLSDAASRSEDPEGKAALLREAALVHRDQLEDAVTASQLLGQAFEQTPNNGALCAELATTLSAAGDHERAIATLSQPLEETEDETMRLELLRGRAALYTAAEDFDGALVDLEQGFAIDPEAVAEDLEAVLNHRLDIAAMAGDEPAERQHTLRCIDMMLVQGKRAEASELLTSWTNRASDDVEALRRLRDIDTADERWQAVADTCRRLVNIETDAAQIDAALALSHAFHELGEPEGAREGLEFTRAAQPQSPQVRAELRKIYVHLGDQEQLASLLVDDAAETEAPAEKADLLMKAGQIYVELGKAPEAVPLLREALKLAPADANVTASLADAYILAGWFDDATELLDQVIEGGRGRRTPEMCLVYHRKAQIAAAIDDGAAELKMLMEAHLCNKKNGQVAAALADRAEELEQWDLAAKTLRTITLLDTDCPISRSEAFLRQGRIAYTQGDEKTAKMWARRAKREDPESEAVDEFLGELGERTSHPTGRR